MVFTAHAYSVSKFQKISLSRYYNRNRYLVEKLKNDSNHLSVNLWECVIFILSLVITQSAMLSSDQPTHNIKPIWGKSDLILPSAYPAIYIYVGYIEKWMFISQLNLFIANIKTSYGIFKRIKSLIWLKNCNKLNVQFIKKYL